MITSSAIVSGVNVHELATEQGEHIEEPCRPQVRHPPQSFI